MNQLDVYYRALLEYRKHTTADRDCTSLRSAIAGADVDNDKVVVKRAICTIEEDWVEAIEEGLVHIEKAIKEERQFIRSNGDVVPIEKVRHVSRESVEHLAKHSNLITRYHEGEDLIPDKIYTVERLSDYAVYENRFLYMLLCYLRDFVTIRHNKILDLTNKYDGKLEMSKDVVNGKQKIRYTVTLHDERRDDPYLSEHNLAKDVIDRISLILKTVLAFLSTPLMEQVSKVAMIKPPITKTNVLKMNNNFRGAVALYDFIIAYDKPGYTVENRVVKLNPFKDNLADEMAEAGSMMSFLAYEYGLGINADLKEEYLKEEQRLAQEKLDQHKEKIKALERKLRAQEIGIEEYTVELEKRLRTLEAESERARKLSAELDAAKKTITEKDKRLTVLEAKVNSLTRKIEELKRAHFLEIQRLKAAHAAKIQALIDKYEAKIAKLIEEYEKKIADLIEEYEAKIAKLIEEYEQKLSDLIDEYEEKIAKLIESYETKISDLIEEYEEKLSDLIDEYEEKVAALKEKHAAEIAALTEKYETEIATLKEDHERQVSELTDRYETELAELKGKHAEEMSELKTAYETEIATLNEKYDTDITELVEKYDTEIATLKEEHATEVSELNERREREVKELNEKRESEISALTENYENEITSIKDRHDQQINTINAEHRKLTDDLKEEHAARITTLETDAYSARESEAQMKELTDRMIAEKNAELAEAIRTRDLTEEKNRLCEARIKALGGIVDGYTDRNSFDTLEREFKTFEKIYKQQWALTKKKIRKDMLNIKNIKGQIEQEKGSKKK